MKIVKELVFNFMRDNKITYVYGNMKNELNKNNKYLDEYKNRHNKVLTVVNNVMNELRDNI